MRAAGLGLAFLLTAFLFIHISYMCRGYDRLMSFYGEREDSMDVVFVGTSVTFSAIAPMDLWDAWGIPACVYATNMQFENAMTYSVREVMKTQSPKLLMVDIAPFVAGCHPASEEWDETNRALFTKFNLDSMKYSAGRTALTWECVRAQGGDFYDFLYYLFDIGRYHTDGLKKRQWDNAFYDVNHGFQYLSRNAGGMTVPSELGTDDGSAEPLPGTEQAYLDRLLKETDGLPCEVVYYCAPVYFSGTSYRRKNEVKRIVTERGGRFWDFSESMEEIGMDPETDFWGYNHPDALGADKATAFIGRRIHEEVPLPDRRGDPAWAQFDRDLESWRKLKQWNMEGDLNWTPEAAEPAA